MISGILQRLKKQSGMIAVAHRMRDGQVHRRRCLAFPGLVLSDGNDREVRWFSIWNPAGVAGKRRPRCAALLRPAIADTVGEPADNLGKPRSELRHGVYSGVRERIVVARHRQTGGLEQSGRFVSQP